MINFTSTHFTPFVPRKYNEREYFQQNCPFNAGVDNNFDFVEFCKLSQALFDVSAVSDSYYPSLDPQSFYPLVNELDCSEYPWTDGPNPSFPPSQLQVESAISQECLNTAYKSDATTATTRRRAQSREEQQQKRRERNKVLARKTRLRKKFLFQGLRNQVMSLYQENLRLKEIVKNHCGINSKKILDDNCLGDMPDIVATCGQEATALIQRSDFTLMKALYSSQPSFCVTNPLVPDCPIVFASDSFIKITGYSREQVLGRNCRFLQGPDTDPDAVRILRKGIVEGKDTDVTILNYNASGEPFWNHVFIAALRDSSGQVINFVGIQHVVQRPVIDRGQGENNPFR
uniref:Aureochrome2 n=1 Tax=Vaucheria frigida TaxID=195983 RepID=A8QW56_VAUFR|nr:aureochrome2 [Vaucheria frigida]BAF91491.1 aureochrome2 [Vaucheria frigida]